MVYITEKLLFHYAESLMDISGQKVEYNNSDFMTTNHSPILLSKTEKQPNINFIDHDVYSIVMSDNVSTFKEYYEKLLESMRDLELVTFQLMLKRPLSPYDFIIWDKMIGIDYAVRDGLIGSQEYNKLVESNKQKNPEFIDSYLRYNNILKLTELIMDEMFHAEHRIIDCINSQLKNVLDLLKKKTFFEGNEILQYNSYTDDAGWCIQDAVKALSTCLDGLCKLSLYMADVINIPSKIPYQHFSKIKKSINNWRDSSDKVNSIKIAKTLEVLTLIRHEFTHNSSLYSLRQPVFVGKRRLEYKELPLMYSEILYWDHDGEKYDTANYKIGFFKKQINALNQMRYFFLQTIKLVTLIVRHLFEEVKQALLSQNIQSVVIFEETEVKRYVQIRTKDIKCSI